MLKRCILFFIFWCSYVYGADDVNKLLDIKAKLLPDSQICLNFSFSKKLDHIPAHFMIQKPARLVVDFSNMQSMLDVKKSLKVLAIGPIASYKVVSVKKRIRVIINLDKPVAYDTKLNNRTFSLVMRGKSNILYQRKKKLAILNRNLPLRNKITHIGFEGAKNAGGKLLVDLSNSHIPANVSQDGNNVTINFHNTDILSSIAKKYNVEDFHSPVMFVTTRQIGSLAKIVLRSQGNYGYYAYQINKKFFVEVYPLTAEQIKQNNTKQQIFTGRKISLNFQSIKIGAILQLLAEFAGENIVVNTDVTGEMTLKLINVPWDQALNLILTTQGLDKRRNGNIILVDKKENFEAREKQALEAKNELQTLAPLRSEFIQINYAKSSDILNLLKAKQTNLLSERGKITEDPRTNAIWVQDTVEQLEQIRDLIKKLDIPVRQVLIEARIVSVRKEFRRDLGVRFGISRPNHLSGTLEGANQLAQGVPAAEVTPLNQRLNVDLGAIPETGNAASLGIALAKLGNNILLDLELSALESEDRVELVSSPRLLTTNQKPAIIEAGEEIPYQEATSSGATAVAFKKAVLSLKVTPQITPDNKVVLALEINQDQNSGRAVLGVPIIITRSIETNVLVDNGQTIVLGGIYYKNRSNNVIRVPFFGSLPIIGNLFKQRNIDKKNEELLIFITPRIITDALTITELKPANCQNGACNKFSLDKFGKRIKTYVK